MEEFGEREHEERTSGRGEAQLYRNVLNHLSLIHCYCCLVTKSCPTLCNPMKYSMPVFLSFTISQSWLKLISIDLERPSNHLILCHPLLLLPSVFPSIRVFSNESALCIRWPKYCSFSISLSMNIQGWFPFNRLVGSPHSPRDSQESSPAPQFKSINSLALNLIYGQTLTSIHDYWKGHSFKFTDLCWQSNVSAF